MDRLYLNREAILEDIRWQREQGILEFDNYNEDAVTDEGIQAFLERNVSSGSIRSTMILAMGGRLSRAAFNDVRERHGNQYPYDRDYDKQGQKKT